MTNNRNISVLKQKMHIFIQSKRLQEAKIIAQNILKISPKDLDANLFLAQFFELTAENTKAVEAYWIASKSDLPTEKRNLILEKMVDLCNQFNLFKHGLKASEEFAKALPDNSKALFFYGFFLHKTNYFLKAIEYLSKAHNQEPENVWCLNYLALSYAFSGRTEEAMPYFDQCEKLNSKEYQAATFRLYAYNCMFNVNEEASFLAHRKYGSDIEKQFPERTLSKPNNKKLRIGYVSADFYWHSVAYFFRAALFGEARKDFDVYCYSDCRKPDDMTAVLQEASDVWRDSTALSDKQLCDQILADKIDILVDLAGYASSHRMGVFAQRAAPIQVTYLGYPNTTGLSRIDYRLTDQFSDPKGETEKFYTEKQIRLPNGFLCYYPNDCAPEVSALPASQQKGHICFGSFNTFQKITPTLLDAWASILNKVKDSSLLIKAGPLHDAEFCDWVRQQFEKNGVESSRIELIGWTKDKIEHLELYNKVDIHLDTFPYNGTTTTCEALWQGVPTITLVGSVHRARVGYSILSQLDMQDYCAETIEDYISKAVEKANNIEELSTLRAQLRERMTQSSLMDVERFSTDLANAYNQMYALKYQE